MSAASTLPDDDTRHRLSRPARLAAGLIGGDERTIEENLFAGTVLIGIEPDQEHLPNARLTLVTLCNQVLRFCPNVLVSTLDVSLFRECLEVAVSLYGVDHGVQMVLANAAPQSTVRVIVGRTDPGDGTIVVNSTGWVARISIGRHGPRRLIPWAEAAPNAVGAVAAGCLGAAHVFFRLIGYAAPASDHELSMLAGETRGLGVLDPGPDLPAVTLTLDALLIGCGAVGNGWAAAIRRLPVAGALGAVDRQPLASENVGPYALAERSDIGTWKVDVIQRVHVPPSGVRPDPVSSPKSG